MRESIHRRLQQVRERHAEVERMLADPDVIADQKQFRELSREYAHHEEIVRTFDEWSRAVEQRDSARAMLDEDDAELRALAERQRLVVRHRDRLVDAIAFRQPPLGDVARVRAAFRLAENDYGQTPTVQLVVEHLEALA